MNLNADQESNKRQIPRITISRMNVVHALILTLILIVGAYLRFVGLNWDDLTHPHPDERFLTMVETSLKLPESVGEYFDTANSKMNPNNVGHGFFVYGSFPVFIVRYLAEWLDKTGYDQVHLVGRTASATFDLISILLVYLIGARLYRRRVGLLAAAFTASSVLLIQHAHFFVVDPFANTFVLIGIYFAVRVYQGGKLPDYLVFGLALGMAVASKISAVTLTLVIIVAAGLTVWKERDKVGFNLERKLLEAFLHLAAAAIVSLITFRILQPYAFQGPGFFGVLINEQWFSNMKEIRHQQSGAVDFPPALQWADRTPVLFALKNQILWGLGLPLGLLAWSSWGWAFARAIRRSEIKHLLLVVFIGAHTLWQTYGVTTTMRYLIPVYPSLALIAAWGVWKAWDWANGLSKDTLRRWGRIGVGSIGSIVLALSLMYAFGFVNIYRQPHTQVEASHWVYANVPAGINLVVEQGDERVLEPLVIPYDIQLIADVPLTVDFQAQHAGTLDEIKLNLRDVQPELDAPLPVMAEIRHLTANGDFIIAALDNTSRTPTELVFRRALGETADLLNGHNYSISLVSYADDPIKIHPQVMIGTLAGADTQTQTFDLPRRMTLLKDTSHETILRSRRTGQAVAVRLPYAYLLSALGEDVILEASLFEMPPGSDPLAQASLTVHLEPGQETNLDLMLDQPVEMIQEQEYLLRLELLGGAPITLRGSTLVAETSWDLGIPFRVEGRDGYGGLYNSRNLELYWADDQDDNQDGVSDKLMRMVNMLDEADYLFISTNRQYGTTTRVPQRYPLTTAYYRALFGCDAPQTVLSCAAQAQLGQAEGALGYELVGVFDSNPKLGSFELNDQLAEEAFTVYDHPKVFLFEKSDAFTAQAVLQLLAQVDLSNVDHSVPKDLGGPPAGMLLPADRLNAQYSNGTWSALFPSLGLQNNSQFIATITWWLFISLLGWITFPLVRAAFGGLRDAGYPLARILGILLLGWGTWFLGSHQVPFQPLTILLVLMLLIVLSALVAWRDWDALKGFVIEHRKTILTIELLALSFFLLDLFIRIGNPDLWHPYKGGEKPMDFSYLNAVLKSTSFPPYDPWFSGGYINYYYFGFVLVGVPIKLLGIDPAVAYNLVLPTLFSMLALAAYSVGSTLVHRYRPALPDAATRHLSKAGLAAAIAILLLGNLGTVRLVSDGLKQLGGLPKEQVATLGQEASALLSGVGQFLGQGADLPFGVDRWYWDPSRVITPGPGEAGPITEFPFFTFLYGDLHAHMINLPFTVAALAWAVSWVLQANRSKRRNWIRWVVSLVLGAVLMGVLKPTNTWDYPVYWALAGIAVLVAAVLRARRWGARELFWGLLEGGILFLLIRIFYAPYDYWYQLGYTAPELWDGSRTGLRDYFVAHGVFLVVIAAWMLWETREWMANTPITALTRLKPHLPWILGLLVVFLSSVGFLYVYDYRVILFVGPMLLWCGLLLLRRDLPLEKRIVLFLIATAIALTFVVEVVRLKGDVSRMNTVFKFYLQVWTMLSISAAAAFAWVLHDLPGWDRGWQIAWISVVSLFVFMAALFPITATDAKIRDRMATEAPHSLDGMAYMPYAVYHEIAGPMDLDADYRAIRWFQENVQGSPVIIEANIPEYRWGARMTIYTGLPNVLGWNWHQRQQRGFAENISVEERARDISHFYADRSVEQAEEFIKTFAVRYVVVGQLERQYYERVSPCFPLANSDQVTCELRGWPMGMPDPDVRAADCELLNPDNAQDGLSCPTFGLDKFDQMETEGLLQNVYNDGATTIYEVAQ